MLQKRMQETQKEKKSSQLESSDMYLNDFKQSFSKAESRNANSRSNKQMVQIKMSQHPLVEADDDDDDERDNPLRQSFGKRGGSLAQLKSKLTLQQELGALRSELGNFEKEPQSDAVKNSWIKDMSSIDQRDDADDLDSGDDEEMERAEPVDAVK